MPRLLSSLLSAGILFGLTGWHDFKNRSWQMLRRRLGGVLFLILAVQITFVGVVFLTIGFFLALADSESFVRPALITGGIAVALAVAAVIEGWRRLRM